MTPLQIEILLHYHCRADDYAEGEFGAPAVRSAIREFLLDETLVQTGQAPHGTRLMLGDRGRVFCEHICRLELPIKRWQMRGRRRKALAITPSAA